MPSSPGNEFFIRRDTDSLSEYSVGTTRSVRNVATARPNITTEDMAFQYWDVSLIMDTLISLKFTDIPVTMGIRPRMVVTAVRNTGLKRVAPADTMA